MELLFLGTGAGDFQATDDAADESAQQEDRNVRYAASGFVVPDILIDCHDTRQLERFCGGVDGVRHLLITHGHFDHFQPEAVLGLAARAAQPLHVYGTAVIGAALAFAAEHVWDAKRGRFQPRTEAPELHFHPVEHGDCFAVGQAQVTAVRASHMLDKPRVLIEQPALNYLVERDGVAVFYGLDSSYLLPETVNVLSEFHLDAVVLDSTFGDQDIDPALSGHMNFAMVAETVAELRAVGSLNDDSAVIVSHISIDAVPSHDRAAADLAGRGITLAYDGMVWDSAAR